MCLLSDGNNINQWFAEDIQFSLNLESLCLLVYIFGFLLYLILHFLIATAFIDICIVNNT